MRCLFFLILLSIPAYSWSSCRVGLEAFRRTLYPQLRASCVNCHGDNGRATPHSQSDAASAYALAKTLVNFNDLPRSRFVRKVRTAHWTEYDEAETGMPETQMLRSLQDWWDAGERDCPPAFSFSTSLMSVSNVLPDVAQGFKTLSWDLAGAGGSYLGCKFLLDVQRFTAASDDIPPSLRVKLPRLQCPGGKTKLVGLRVLLDGQSWPYENLYDGLNLEVQHFGNEEILSTDLMILVGHTQTISNLSVGFVGLMRQ